MLTVMSVEGVMSWHQNDEVVVRNDELAAKSDELAVRNDELAVRSGELAQPTRDRGVSR